jgi:hypothetical protein
MICPSGRPQVQDGIDLFVNADWLIWQARETGTPYAVKTQAVQAENTALYNSSIKHLSFDWNFGFRFGIGYNLPHDGWDVVANWTWFQDKAKGNVSTNSGLIYATNAFPLANPTVTGFASSNANLWLKLNMIDLDLGREFFVSKWMTLRPFIGLRNAWIYQTVQSNYQSPSFTSIPVYNPTTNVYSKAQNNYWGLGLHSGLNSQWGLGAGLSFFGNASFSIINGFFKLNDYQTNNLSNGAHNDFVTNKNTVHTQRVIAELATGLRWETMFADDGAHFQVQAGWEQLMFFGQNQFSNFFGSLPSAAGNYFANQGDLSMQGWTLSVRVDF